MNSTERLFVNILGNYINDIPIDQQLFESVEEERLKELVKIHKVASIVYSATKDKNISKELKEYLEMGFLSEMAFHQKKVRVLGKLKEILSKEDIDHIVIKGSQIYALYPNPEFRTMGDLDLLIQKEDMQRMKDAFVSHGIVFVPENSVDNVWDFKARGTEVEIHSNLVSEGRLMNGYDYMTYFQDPFNHRKNLEGHTWKLDVEYNLAYLIFHIAKHFYNSGCGVRMLMDLPIVIKSETINWGKLWRMLEEIELKGFALQLFSLCEKWFGEFGVEYPDDYHSEKIDYSQVEDFIIGGGIYGFHGRNTDADIVKMKINENDGKGSYIRGVILWAFPSCKRMREYSPWFSNKPAILLPVAYGERFMRNIRERGGIVKLTINIIKGKKDLSEKEQILKIMKIE